MLSVVNLEIELKNEALIKESIIYIIFSSLFQSGIETKSFNHNFINGSEV